VQTIRYAWRGLRRTPGFTLVAVLTLALGIGANTAFFGLVDAIVFRPTSIARLDHVFTITMKDPPAMTLVKELQPPDFRAIEASRPATVTAVAGVVGAARYPSLVQVPGRAEYVLIEVITGGYADVFGLHAQAGRWISPDDDRDGAQVAVISDRLWREWFGASPDVVGHATISSGSRRFTIVGVAPPGFRGVQTGLAPTEVWVPLGTSRSPQRSYGGTDLYGQYHVRPPGVQTFVKVQPGVATGQAVGDLRAVMTTQSKDPAAPTLALRPAREALRVDELVAMGVGTLAFSGLVLLAACANLANLLYARGTQRASEIAVRLSLGASTGDILRLFLAEATLIACVAAALGLALASAATHAFTAAFPTFRLAGNLGVTIDVSPDYRVFFYAFGAGAFAALVVGLVTAWRSSRVPVTQALASSATSSVVSSRRRGLPTTFVSVQITAAVLLLIGAGLFLENTRSALDRRVHYDTSLLTAARVDVPRIFSANYRAEASEVHVARAREFFDSLLARASQLPGIEHVALVDALPGGTAPAPNTGSGTGHLTAEEPPAGGRERPHRANSAWVYASPGLLETIGVPLRRGRDFWPSDARDTRPVAILSESAADALWPGEDPIGKHITCCELERQSITVVGVAADPVSSSDDSPLTRASNVVFLPASQGSNTEMLVVVRSAKPAAQVEPLRAAVRSLDDTAPVFDAGPVDEFLLAGVAVERAKRALTTTLGLLALGIAMLGVYAVVGYFVSRRTREFGLRLALGAAPRQIVKLVVDYSVHIILVGLLPGVLLASLGTRLVEHQLFGIMPNGITMWVVAPLLMLAAGVVAGFVPAHRAAGVDPNVTLREL
jgi:predicted permease